MKIEVTKQPMTEPLIKQIIEIDKEFYHDFDFSDTSWYYKRYASHDDIFTLSVDGKIVGYFLFWAITKSLFKDIYALKYHGDYTFPLSQIIKKSKYYYVPSVLIRKDYRQYGFPLLKRLWQEARTKENLIAITVSPEGHKMASSILTLVGYSDPAKDIRVYARVGSKL